MSIYRFLCASRSSALSVSCTMPSMIGFVLLIGIAPPILLKGLLIVPALTEPAALRRSDAPRSAASAFLGLACAFWYCTVETIAYTPPFPTGPPLPLRPCDYKKSSLSSESSFSSSLSLSNVIGFLTLELF